MPDSSGTKLPTNPWEAVAYVLGATGKPVPAHPVTEREVIESCNAVMARERAFAEAAQRVSVRLHERVRKCSSCSKCEGQTFCGRCQTDRIAVATLDALLEEHTHAGH